MTIKTLNARASLLGCTVRATGYGPELAIYDKGLKGWRECEKTYFAPDAEDMEDFLALLERPARSA